MAREWYILAILSFSRNSNSNRHETVGFPKQYDDDRRNKQLFEWGRGLAENKSWKYCEDDVEDDVNEDEDQDNDDEQVS